jgi:hypothetical protein
MTLDKLISKRNEKPITRKRELSADQGIVFLLLFLFKYHEHSTSCSHIIFTGNHDTKQRSYKIMKIDQAESQNDQKTSSSKKHFKRKEITLELTFFFLIFFYPRCGFNQYEYWQHGNYKTRAGHCKAEVLGWSDNQYPS